MEIKSGAELGDGDLYIAIQFFLDPRKGSVHYSDQFAQDKGPSQDMEL